MNQRDIATQKRARKSRARTEWPTLIGLVATVVVMVFQAQLFGDLSDTPLTLVKFLGLFGVMMVCAFGVVRHADAVAELLGEPYGTLVLTLSVTVIEVSLMASIIMHGENNPTLARDVMFSTLMIVLNGMIGLALVIGALRHWEQEYNLEGARAFLVVIASLAVFGLIIPNYTKSIPDPSKYPFQAGLFATITILFYVMFVIIQTVRHRAFFAEPVNGNRAVREDVSRHGEVTGSLSFHVAMLLLSLAPVVLLSEYLAILVDHGIERLQLPAALGGMVNVCLGSALATIGLTIPAVLTVGLLTGRDVHLGLDQLQEVLLILTLFVSALTFGGPRTNVLQGIVHMLLFFVYLALIVSP